MEVENKKGSSTQMIVVHLILIGILFSIFFLATAEKINARGLRQQVIEKEVALAISAAEPGMTIEISKLNPHGYIDYMRIKESRVFATIDGLPSAKGYPFSSPNSVGIETKLDRYTITITK